ncbi:MAG: hypothetical protein IT385_30345 [Deltaproteobacteria bacterium]|nr:hypothetical protein [Deltaproteobacteria bacterium]
MPRPSPRETDIEARHARFVQDAARYGLRYRCRDCAHVVPSTVTCSMLFPNEMLRDVDGPFQADGSYAFCKYFELT